MQDTGCSGLVHWDDPEGWDGDGGGRWGSEWGTHVHPWRIHVHVWQNQYNIVKFLKKELKKKNKIPLCSVHPSFSQSLAATVFFYCFHAAAAAAKSLQSCLTPCDPIDGSPSGSTVPGILQARTLEWVAISFSNA